MKSQIEKTKDFMEQNQYFIGNDLFAHFISAEKELKTEIEMAYEFGKSNKDFTSGEEYYNHIYKTDK